MSVSKLIFSGRLVKSIFVILFCLAFALINQTSTVLAFDQGDLNSVLGQTPWFDPNTVSACSATVSDDDVPPGTLPSIIPEPYNGAFTAGGNAHNVYPALVAAIFTEENFTGTSPADLATMWKDFPVGTQPDPDSGWPYSHIYADEFWQNGEAPNALRQASGNPGGQLPANGAGGPFQFEPDTWKGLSRSTSDNSEEDIVTAANGAAQYLASDGATENTPPASWAAGPNGAIWHYNGSQAYVDQVMTYYNFYSTGGTDATPPPAATTTTNPCTGTASAVSCQGSAPAGTANLSTVRQNAVCVVLNELSLWKSGAMKAGFIACTGDATTCTSFSKYSQNQDQLWCADFASWAYNQVNYPIPASGNWITPDVETIFEAGGGNPLDLTAPGTGSRWDYHPIAGYTPVPGDLAIHYDPDQSNPFAHVNMVVSVSGNTPTLVGGDEVGPDFPDGSIVSEDTYTTDVIGYVSPNN